VKCQHNQTTPGGNGEREQITPGGNGEPLTTTEQSTARRKTNDECGPLRPIDSQRRSVTATNADSDQPNTPPLDTTGEGHHAPPSVVARRGSDRPKHRPYQTTHYHITTPPHRSPCHWAAGTPGPTKQNSRIRGLEHQMS